MVQLLSYTELLQLQAINQLGKLVTYSSRSLPAEETKKVFASLLRNQIDTNFESFSQIQDSGNCFRTVTTISNPALLASEFAGVLIKGLFVDGKYGAGIGVNPVPKKATGYANLSEIYQLRKTFF